MSDEENEGPSNTSRRISFYNEISPDDECSSYDSDEFYGREVQDENQIDDREWFEYLNEDDRNEIQNQHSSKITVEDWEDCFISDVGEECKLVLDSSKKETMKQCVSEINHIKSRLEFLLNKSCDSISVHDLIDLAFGERSQFYKAFSSALDINRLEFCQFFGNLSLQMSYKETVTGMYDELSFLKSNTLMSEDEYLNVFQQIANKRRVSTAGNNFIGSSRREKCLWELLEIAVNEFLRSITVVNRGDEISVSFDDDKIWAQTSGRNDEDHFGLRRVTHVKDNRRGIISHTAVSVSTIMPIGFVFERKGNNAISCFKTMFGRLFPPNDFDSLPNLNGVLVQSDQGYTLEATIFQFLIPAGAQLNNTSKRIPPFPFLWGMKKKRNDNRTLLKESGCPALYVKQLFHQGEKVSCFAFRTGTSNIATVISSTIDGHQWEGVCLNYKQRLKWEADKIHGLDAYIFPALATNDELFSRLENERFALFDDLKDEKVHILTLEQGTADWHKGRQFSFTSSQSDGAFKKAFINFQNDESWCKIATYLDGQDYHTRKLCFLLSMYLFYTLSFSIPHHTATYNK